MQRYEHGGYQGSQLEIELDLSINVNPLGMPENAKQAIIRDLDSFAHYPDAKYRNLRAALAERYDVGEDMVLCGNGATELIYSLCSCIRPKKTLTLAPTFSEYERAAALFGAETREHLLCEETGFALTEAILEAISPELDIVFLCNPNNPTGRLASPSLCLAVADACEAAGVYLVIDECFIDFTDGQSMIPAVANHPHLLILNAFTKIYGMAGLRLGFMIGQSAVLSRIARFIPEWSVSSVAQTAGLSALRTSGWTEAARSAARAEREYMTENLTSLGLFVYPSDANFLLVRSTLPLVSALMKKKIYVRRCDNFTGLGENFMRIGLRTREENNKLLRALSEVLHG